LIEDLWSDVRNEAVANAKQDLFERHIWALFSSWKENILLMIAIIDAAYIQMTYKKISHYLAYNKHLLAG
jgi:hypothetical protein